MTKCKNIELTFLITSLIQNQEALNGAIIDKNKIHDYNPEYSIEDIESVLDCFVDNELLVKSNLFSCYNDHFFNLDSSELEYDYHCIECENNGYEDYVIEKELLSEQFISTSYRIHKFNNSIWKAKALYISNNTDEAIKTMYDAIKKEDKEFSNLSSEKKIEKISSHFGFGMDLISFGEKIQEVLGSAF
ncbi:hypothetical protein ACN09M_10380 [Aliarcobacter butzleri]|uniref:hypothetical protein n=1 Tax=Aliarcobacter butzleri TaxID=28197 RepID=UPI003AEDA487